jgi:hypothetical protein
MPVYKFYRIAPKDTTRPDCYIGHTIQELRKRFTEHCKTSNTTSSKALFDRYGKDNLEIILIHELELPNREYARREERRLWEEVREQAVNRWRPWVSEEEKKQYWEVNKEVLSAREKKRRAAKKATLLLNASSDTQQTPSLE